MLIRKCHVISAFSLLNYSYHSLFLHFSKLEIGVCILYNIYPCLSCCTELFQHDLPFGQKEGLLVIND